MSPSPRGDTRVSLGTLPAPAGLCNLPRRRCRGRKAPPPGGPRACGRPGATLPPALPGHGETCKACHLTRDDKSRLPEKVPSQQALHRHLGRTATVPAGNFTSSHPIQNAVGTGHVTVPSLGGPWGRDLYGNSVTRFITAPTPTGAPNPPRHEHEHEAALRAPPSALDSASVTTCDSACHPCPVVRASRGVH